MDDKDNLDIDTATSENSDMFNSDLETLNVNVWFNKLESRLQYCLVKDNVKDGFTQYKLIVKHIEMIAISSGKIKDADEYKKELTKQIGEIDDYTEKALKDMQESMIRYKLILKYLFKVNKSDMSLT